MENQSENTPVAVGNLALVMPQATILSYFEAISPTRVRLVAARALWMVVALCCLSAGWFAYELIDEASRWNARISKLADILDLLESNRQLLWFWIVPAVALLVIAIVIVCCIPGVRRGKRASAIIAFGSLGPLTVATFLTIMICGLRALLEGSGWFPGRIDRSSLLFLVPAAIGVLLLLLLKDLMGFILWIKRNPGTEKRPVAFLTGKEILR